MSEPTDLEKRVTAGYGSPMLGTRWKLQEPGCFKEHLTYTELQTEIRKLMLETRKRESFEVRIEREDY